MVAQVKIYLMKKKILFNLSHSQFPQGTGLEIRPEPMRAVDQDAGINASIRYAWNAGICPHVWALMPIFKKTTKEC